MKLLMLLSYDIASDKGRTKLAKQLEQYGFERIQYSVFAGHCSTRQWVHWRRVLTRLFDKFKTEGDKFYAIPQSEKYFRHTEMNGAEFDIDWITGRTLILYL